MPDYSKGKIYTIRCRTDDTHIYVGSTIQTLSQRIKGHRHASKKEGRKGTIFYQTVAGDWSNWFIELYEDCPCERVEHLTKREGEVIRQISTLNKCVPGRSREEYLKDNKELLKEKAQLFYKNNKDKIDAYNAYNKEYKKEYKKEYREKNRERLIAYDKTYYEGHKAEAAEYNKRKRLANSI